MKKILTALTVALFSGLAFAWQPTKTVEITVPFPPGSGNDAVIRPLAEAVTKNTGVKFNIINRAGAGGTVGSMHFVKSDNDGHFINIISVGGVAAMDYTWSSFLQNPPYNVNSFTYATALAQSPLVVVANKNDSVSTPDEFVKVLLNDKNVTVAESGGAGKLALEVILLHTDAKKINPGMIRVEHKGPMETINDIMGGHVRFGTVPLPVAHALYSSGDLKIVGLVQQNKINGLNIAAFNTVNKNIDSVLVWGIALPKGTAPEVLEWYAKHFKEAQNDPKVKELFAKNQFFPVTGLQTPKSFTEYVLNQQKQYAPVVNAIVQNIKK